MAFRFVCYGKSLVNVERTLEAGVVGSASMQFIHKLEPDDMLFLYARKHIWAVAHADGKGFIGQDQIWEDDLYPYRVRLKSVRVLATPFSFQESKFRGELLELLGRAWPYKVLFTPNKLPDEIGSPLHKLLVKEPALDSSGVKSLIRANIALGLNKRQLKSLPVELLKRTN